jgi:hypothetical protein
MSHDKQNNDLKILSSVDDEVGMSERDWVLLLSRIKNGECTPFLGSAVSNPPLPLGSDLAIYWSEKFNYPHYDLENLPKVAQFIALYYDSAFIKSELTTHFEEILKRNKGLPNFNDDYQIHRVLADLPLPIYLTTNYDDFMVRALKFVGKNDVVSDYCRWNALIDKLPGKIDKDNKFEPTVDRPLVYHLHGNWDNVDSMVLTEDDYIEFLRNVNKQKLHHRILRAFAGTTLLFLGYRLEDFTFRTIFKGLIDAVSKGLRRYSISVQLNPKSEARERISDILKSIKGELATRLSPPSDPGYQNVIEEISAKIAKYQNEKRAFAEITLLESKLTKLAIEKDRDDQESLLIHTVANRINLLQNAIERLHRAIRAKEFFQEYFKESAISIYWGRIQDFAKELRERCVKEGIIN